MGKPNANSITETHQKSGGGKTFLLNLPLHLKVVSDAGIQNATDVDVYIPAV